MSVYPHVPVLKLITASAWTFSIRYSRVCWNEWCYNVQIFISKIWLLQRTQMLKRTRRNTIGRRSTSVRMKCRALPIWLERQSPSLLSFVRFSDQFSSFISVINQLDAQNFCFTISLFHASTCFEHMCSTSGGQNYIIQPLVSSHL